MFSPNVLLRLGILFPTTLLLLLAWHSISLYSPTTSSPWTQYLSTSQDATVHTPLHDTSNIFLILKTGASVISSRLPAHINTTLPAAKHLLLPSSLAQTFQGYQVHDILTNVSSLWKTDHKDFEVYRQLQSLSIAGNASEKATAELASGKAWDLDKWKFMPMLFESYRSAADEVEWFVMMEADTSLSWTNLVWWLNTMDSRRARYMGAPNYCVVEPCKGQIFAHGGSGILWSRTAVEKVVQIREQEGVDAYDRRWEEITNQTCCGDIVLAEAFQEAGVGLTKAGPMIQGASLESFVWEQKDWCRPAITWHHVTSEEVEQMHDFSERWAMEQRTGTPYFFSDVYAEFLARRRKPETAFWDNKSRTKGNGSSRISCRRACEREKSCVQWMFAEDEEGSSCMFGERFSMGEQLEDEEDEDGRAGNWTSGWIEEKIEKLIQGFGPC